MSIKRYDASWYQEEMVPEPMGEWVRYEDHRVEVDRLRAQVNAQREVLEIRRLRATLEET